jgi:hypothetical protein
VIDDYCLDCDFFGWSGTPSCCWRLRRGRADGLDIGSGVHQPVERNVVKPLEAGGVLDGFPGTADQVVGELQGRDGGRGFVGPKHRELQGLGPGIRWGLEVARDPHTAEAKRRCQA